MSRLYGDFCPVGHLRISRILPGKVFRKHERRDRVRAIKMNVTIGPERQLSIDLPNDIPKGPAELILLTYGGSETDKKAQTDDFRAWLEKLVQRNPVEIPKELLDKRIEMLRNDWE
jgi:hypothetical protein